MPIQLEPADQADVVRLVEALDAHQKPLYPPECHYGIPIAALVQPNVLFAVARDDAGQAVACGAIVLGEDFGELKRMFVQPAHRGQGLAQGILEFLQAQALARGCSQVMLETGIRQPEAIGLYERSGFVRRGPFGDYPDDPLSVFMAKNIA
ncbi:GNAT family N-acetyltransferase [Variovorax sp. HJSM1_2]|uniref:GNAT family N-acetyltransferase n=1 Tax=Variovorax sp. HJSM1_2 TaxID=3366263 RepID=UPI003BDDFE4D